MVPAYAYQPGVSLLREILMPRLALRGRAVTVMLGRVAVLLSYGAPCYAPARRWPALASDAAFPLAKKFTGRFSR